LTDAGGRFARTTLRDVDAVVFDLDGTLLDRRQSFERFVRHQWERFASLVQAVEQERYVQTVIELDGDGYAPRHGLFTGAVVRFGLAEDLAGTLLEDYRAGFPGTCLLFPDAAPTLSLLRGSGLKLGLITNGSVRMQSRKLACLELSSAFDAIMISAAEGIHKPDPRIFHRALAQLEVSPARAVFVGDNPEVDIAGAHAAGMRAIWRRDPRVVGPVEADAVIEQVGDLVAILGFRSEAQHR
jgi:putative hydrolase of the HAD superfamily